MRKLAVVHYMPLEFYPPVINFLNYICSETDINIGVYSTKNNKKRKEYSNELLSYIHRVPLPEPNEGQLWRLYKYLKFNISCFISLIKFNPEEVLYYESYSAAPVYWYLRLFGKNKKLKIHYHEYASPEWYRNGMRLVKTYHKMEKKFLYKKADWISHTNKERIRLFLKDNPEVNPQKMHILPNYPPKSWLTNKSADKKPSDAIRTVYVGSLSLKSTYIKEYCEWVVRQEGKIYFDIYSYNLHSDSIFFLEKLNSDYIRFHKGGLEYDELPFILRNYDVGVILYKALTDNFKFNAPNKLFEYMACGLEVWFSDKMSGCFPYETKDVPNVVSVDFGRLEDAHLLNRTENLNSPKTRDFEYTAESALNPLVKLLSS